PANESGTLLEAINLWDSFTNNLTKTNTYERAKKAVEWLVVQGVQHIRAHTDCTESSLQTMQAILQLKEDMQSLVDIQVVAFPQNGLLDRKSTRLNSSHVSISYAVFCLKKKKD